jgi:hypothetical protein
MGVQGAGGDSKVYVDNFGESDAVEDMWSEDKLGRDRGKSDDAYKCAGEWW